MQPKPKIKVLFNDSHTNLPIKKAHPQGGPSRFAELFSQKMSATYKDIELISLLFTHNTENQNIYIKKTFDKHWFYEIVYPKEKLLRTYNKSYNKKSYLKFLKPWLNAVTQVIEESKPDLIFLNGFSLSNWVILESAFKQKIPVYIQHAGIWKKEIISSQDNFSPSIRKIFSSLEKEIFDKATHQIFLNDFSQKEFFQVHNLKLDRIALQNISIIPLPIEIKQVHKVQLPRKITLKIGVVARWDKIKNHSAILRLAKYYKNNEIQNQIEVVTKWSPKLIYNFKDEYQKSVKIIDPMSPKDLRKFYQKQDLVLIPSRFDVSPTVLMEAIMLGKPVLISNKVGWIDYYQKNGLNKLVFTPQASGQNIDGSITTLVKNPHYYFKLFDKLQKTIIHTHDSRKVFDQYYKLFKKNYELNK